MGLAARYDSFDMLMRVDFIIIVSVLALAVAWVAVKRTKAQVTSAQTKKITDASAYGAGDRLLHALAFSGPGVQKSLARTDDRLYRRQIERFNRTVRHEWLDLHVFDSIEQAQQLATQWLWIYNNERPHTAIGGIPPWQLLKAA